MHGGTERGVSKGEEEEWPRRKEGDGKYRQWQCHSKPRDRYQKSWKAGERWNNQGRNSEIGERGIEESRRHNWQRRNEHQKIVIEL